ncbi:hypothetical protein BaRGS_00033183 [Batillaria attramentaria]|uniref:Uncharacterized protein n=1 Tax=Batillaria attramentaria TaxID=370345 RepID=A0ABD0JKQ8_9CAEN
MEKSGKRQRKPNFSGEEVRICYASKESDVPAVKWGKKKGAACAAHEKVKLERHNDFQLDKSGLHVFVTQ